MKGLSLDPGRTAVVESEDGISVVVSERKVPPFDAGVLQSVGIDPRQCRVIVAKSAIAWRSAYGAVARRPFTSTRRGSARPTSSASTYRAPPASPAPLRARDAALATAAFTCGLPAKGVWTMAAAPQLPLRRAGRSTPGWKAHADEMLAFASRLIQTPSENRPPNGDERAAQELLAETLRSFGAEVDMFDVTDVPGITEHPAYLEGRHYAGRPNVVGRFAGPWRRTLPHLFEPYGYRSPRSPALAEDGALFGGDQRRQIVGPRQLRHERRPGRLPVGDLAARAVAPELRGDLFLESVVDEEWGGANGTLAARLRGYTADAAIIPEPTGLQICPEHWGAHLYRLTVPGSAGMVFGNPHLQNPIYTSMLFIDALREWEKEYHARPAPPMYEGGPKPPFMVTAIEARQYGIPRTCTVDFAVSFYKEDDPDEMDRRALPRPLSKPSWVSLSATRSPGLSGCSATCRPAPCRRATRSSRR